jgi:hypothetical protein
MSDIGRVTLLTLLTVWARRQGQPVPVFENFPHAKMPKLPKLAAEGLTGPRGPR